MTGLAAAPDLAHAKDTYVIHLSNNYVGNDWRQQMERVAVASVNKGPLEGRVELIVENAESTVEAQINSLNNIIRQKPDATLVDAASATALNPTIRKVCDAGILVVTFDQLATEPCALAVTADWDRIPTVMAEWIAEQIGGKGNVIVDRGLAGTPIAAQIVAACENVIASYPDIKIVGYYNADYALGPEKTGVASTLAANPQVDGVLGIAYGTGAMEALREAGRPLVPVVGFSYNVSAVTCAQTEDAVCMLGSNPTYLSSEAIRHAVDVLDSGERPQERMHILNSDFLTTHPFDPKLYPDSIIKKIEIGVNAFPDLAPALTVPISPDWVDITPEEASGT